MHLTILGFPRLLLKFKPRKRRRNATLISSLRMALITSAVNYSRLISRLELQKVDNYHKEIQRRTFRAIHFDEFIFSVSVSLETTISSLIIITNIITIIIIIIIYIIVIIPLIIIWVSKVSREG